MVFSNDKGIIIKYGDMAFMDFGKEYTSAKLSQLMGNITGPIVGWPVTISAWRHINIAMKRKLCNGSLDTVDNITTSHLIHAQQSGHSVVQENRIYGLSPDALLGASEDVLHLYLDASTDWQVVNKIVPGGLGIAYKDAKMTLFDNLVLKGVIKHRQANKFTTSTTTTTTTTTVDNAFLLSRIKTFEDTMILKQNQLMDVIQHLQAEIQTLNQGCKCLIYYKCI